MMEERIGSGVKLLEKKTKKLFIKARTRVSQSQYRVRKKEILRNLYRYLTNRIMSSP